MALFKHTNRVRQSESLAFDRLFRAGNDAPYEGVYVCVNCGLEILAKGGVPLPAPRQRPHRAWCTGVQWQLLVSTNTETPRGHAVDD